MVTNGRGRVITL